MKKDFNNPLTVDGLFLLGILAGYPSLRTIIGENEGVQEVMTLLRNHLKDDGTVGVVTNALSAMGNIVLDNRHNDDIFIELDGLRETVGILVNRRKNAPEVNAAAALMANSSFKRDDVKAMYGGEKIGGPQALAGVLRQYDGSVDDSVQRSLISIFKAIANLALFVPNVNRLLEEELDKSYIYCFDQFAGLSDLVIGSGLVTLANLTQEYKPDVAAKFQPILKGLIAAGESEARQDHETISIILESISSLCRLKSNAVHFVSIDGVPFLINVISGWASYSSQILICGAQAIGVIARNGDCVPLLIESGALPLILSMLNGEYYGDDATLNVQYEVAQHSLRALRKMIAAYPDPAVFGTFCQGGATETWVWFLNQLSSVEEGSSALLLEALQFGCGLVEILNPDISTCATTDKMQAFLESREPQRNAEGSPETEFPADGGFLAAMGIQDATQYGGALNDLATLLELECAKSNTPLIKAGACLIMAWLSYLPTVPGAMEELIMTQDETGVIHKAMVKLSMVTDQVDKCIPEFIEAILQMVANFELNFGSDALSEHLSSTGELLVSLQKVRMDDMNIFRFLISNREAKNCIRMGN